MVKQRRVIGMDRWFMLERREFILTLGSVNSERINRQSGAAGVTGWMGFGPAGSGSIAGSGSGRDGCVGRARRFTRGRVGRCRR